MTRKLDAQIDELYQQPLAEFTKARNALAKTLSGDDRKTVGSLVKPSLPMWLINQLYWKDAPTYNALIDASQKLRTAHRAVLSGRSADTRGPDQLHRTTTEKAFKKATEIASRSGVKLTPSVSDIVRRTLAALPGGEPAGRLTRPPDPAGFSLITGIKVQDVATPPKPGRAAPRVPPAPQPSRAELQAQMRIEREARRRAERERKEAERRAQKEKQLQERREREIRKAEQALKEAERRLAELKTR